MIKKFYERFNESVYIIKLKNGMQVHILPKEEPYFTTYVELSVPFGALDLNYKDKEEMVSTPYGTAHFLEHKIYKNKICNNMTKNFGIYYITVKSKRRYI